ncbi:MAG: type II toxin-antitoxin system VapC family toxin [Desulfobacterales bacterium]|nr:type II toxin-antitoxin system VapC family toxin [Desulfobacterales bacterium]
MFLLDTDTLIYSLKGHDAVIENLKIHRQDPLRTSVISLMELYYGAYKSEKITANLAKVRRIENAFEILPVDFSIAETFGMIKSTLEYQGTPMDDFDLAIAACALAHNLTLVTNNERHFLRVEGLKLDNWTRA